MENKLKKLEEMMKLLNDGLSKSDFLDAFSAVVKQILRLEKELIKKMDGKTSEAERKLAELEREFNQVIENAKEESDSTLAGFKRKTIETINALFIKSRVNEKLQEVLNEYNSKLPQMDDKIKEVDRKLAEVRDGEDGKDADEDAIFEKLKKEIPEIKEETAEEIRDKLEKLNGEERLRMEAINGLKEALDEIKKTPRVIGGGGFSKLAMDIHFLDPYIPTGTIDGVNTDFVLSHTPSPTTSLKVYRGGAKQRLTDDYTLSGLTITFLVAPVVGETIEVEHRI